MRAVLAEIVWVGVLAAITACDDPRARVGGERLPPLTGGVDAAPPPAPPPLLVVTPGRRTWSPRVLGQSWWHTFTVANVGHRDVHVEPPVVRGDDAFSVYFDGVAPELEPWRFEDPDRDGRPGLAPGGAFDLKVFFRPIRPGLARAALVIPSDDPNHREREIELEGEGLPLPPCEPFEPHPLEFVDTAVGLVDRASVTVRNCSAGPVELRELVFEGDGSFGVDRLAPPALPLVLRAPSDDLDRPEIALDLEFRPLAAGRRGGFLRIETQGDGAPPYLLELRGTASPNVCPTALLREQRLAVPYGEWARLDASPSSDPERGALRYFYTVTARPEGSVAALGESVAPGGVVQPDLPTTPVAALLPDRPGTYRVELEVVDDHDNRATDCGHGTAARIDVAPPAEGFLAVLTWESPADPDPADAVGSDLDLHLIHPEGAQWFYAPWDCFAANPAPAWGRELGAADNPVVAVAGLDGGGPEIIRLRGPDETRGGAPYRLGVHVFRQLDREDGSDYGPSFARVEIYARGQLVWSSEADAGLWRMGALNHFWEVAAIEWPGPRVLPIGRYFEGRP